MIFKFSFPSMKADVKGKSGALKMKLPTPASNSKR